MLLQLFDSDLDFPAGRLRLWSPGAAAPAAAGVGMVEAPAAVLNETGLLGLRITSVAALQKSATATAASGAAAASSSGGGSGAATAAGLPGVQPFVGIVDCGSSFTVLNWAAAALAGLPPKGAHARGDRRGRDWGRRQGGRCLTLECLPCRFALALLRGCLRSSCRL